MVLPGWVRVAAGCALCAAAAAVLAVGAWRAGAGGASGAAPPSLTTTFDCDVLMRGDGAIVTVPEAKAEARGATDAGVPPAPSAWPAGSSAAISCLRVRDTKPAERTATPGLGLYVAGALLLVLLAMPLLVPTLLSEDDAGTIVSTTRVVVYALIGVVVVNFVRRVFDGVETGDLGVDKWLTGLAGVGIAAKVAQTFGEKP